MKDDDQVAEWLIRWEEALAADKLPPDLEQLPPELRERAREGMRFLRDFAGLSHDMAPAAQAPPDTPRYRFEEFLAAGGMGEVWRGRDLVLGRQVALKVLRQPVLGFGELRARFAEEARHVGQLEHPAIVPVYDLGELPDGRPFFVMKLIHGQTLAELLQAREPAEDLSRWIEVFEQVCHAVAFAHERGLIHRDLKPSNVMLGAFGEVQVMDWGIAKALASERRVDPPTRPLPSPSVPDQTAFLAGLWTLPGEAKGTPAFMAPEQARGEIDRIGKASDVFGLGGILCVILTGQAPYTHTRQALAGDVEGVFSRLDACGADADLIRLAKACLAPAPEARPADAAAVAARVKLYHDGVAERRHRAERESLLRQVTELAEQAVLSLALITIPGECCRIAIQSVVVCGTDNSAIPPLARTIHPREFYPAPRSIDPSCTPPLPRRSVPPLQSRFSEAWHACARSAGFTAAPRNGSRSPNGSSRRPVRTARSSARSSSTAFCTALTRATRERPCVPGGSFAAIAMRGPVAGGPSASGSPTKSDASA
jgi:serine/threonine protein kinase